MNRVERGNNTTESMVRCSQGSALYMRGHKAYPTLSASASIPDHSCAMQTTKEVDRDGPQ